MWIETNRVTTYEIKPLAIPIVLSRHMFERVPKSVDLLNLLGDKPLLRKVSHQAQLLAIRNIPVGAWPIRDTTPVRTMCP